MRPRPCGVPEAGDDGPENPATALLLAFLAAEERHKDYPSETRSTGAARRRQSDHFLAFADFGSRTTAGVGRLYRIDHGTSFVTLQAEFPASTIYGDCVLTVEGVPYCRGPSTRPTLYFIAATTGSTEIPSEVAPPGEDTWVADSWKDDLSEVFVYSKPYADADLPSLFTGR